MEAGGAIRVWLRERNEDRMIQTFGNLVQQFGIEALQSYTDNGSKHKHGILHDLVKAGKQQVLVLLIQEYRFDPNVQRASDGCTPLHLARWQNLDAISEALLGLGADPALQNNYGENAAQVKEAPKPIAARLQGAATVEDILSLVDSDLERFSGQERVQAYYKLSEKTSNYDNTFCTFVACHDKQRALRANASFGVLVQACEAAARQQEANDDGSLWSTLIRALVMLTDDNILKVLSSSASAGLVPFQSWPSYRLVVILRDLAKIKGDPRRFADCFSLIGDVLAQRDLAEIGERELTSLVWSFAKVNLEDYNNREALLRQIDHSLQQRAGMLSPQAVSVTSWSYAKLGHRDDGVMEFLAEEALRLMDSFRDQNVANTAWAFSQLAFVHERLFSACLRKASITLYEDVYRRHALITAGEKLMHWAQIYIAYLFCSVNCPAALDSMSTRLAQDLEQYWRHRNHQDVEAFSENSGLDSERSVQELDKILDSLASEFTAEAAWAPEDSMEAEMVQAIPENVEASNSMVSQGLADSRPDPMDEHIILLEFSRSPEPFRRALLEGPELEGCRKNLEQHGFSPVLDCRAKMFVRPEQYELVCKAIVDHNLKLKAWHVVVATEFEPLVIEALTKLPRSDQVSMKKRPTTLPKYWDVCAQQSAAAPLSPEPTSDTASSGGSHGFEITVKRTFINVATPSSLYSGRNGRLARSEP